MPTDFLGSLLNESLRSPGSGYSSDIFRPDVGIDTRGPQIDAIIHYLQTGQEPTAIPTPSGGPIGSLLQGIGLRSKFQDVSPELRDRMSLAKTIRDQQSRQEALETLRAIQDFSTRFGGKAGQDVATALGAPELGKAIPTDVRGTGELAMTAQDLKLRQMLMSNDIQQQKLANQELALQIRDAQNRGAVERAQQLLDLRNEAESRRESQFESAPVRSAIQGRLASLNQRLLRYQDARGRIDETMPGAEKQAKYFDDLISKTEAEIDRLTMGIGTSSKEEDLRKLLTSIPTSSAPAETSKSGLPRGIFK